MGSVLDRFCGSGTTLVACAAMKRIGVRVEINARIASLAEENIQNFGKTSPEARSWVRRQKLMLGDSRFLDRLGLEPNSFDLVFAHPPYGQLIDFSDENGVAAEICQAFPMPSTWLR